MMLRYVARLAVAVIIAGSVLRSHSEQITEFAGNYVGKANHICLAPDIIKASFFSLPSGCGAADLAPIALLAFLIFIFMVMIAIIETMAIRIFMWRAAQ